MQQLAQATQKETAFKKWPSWDTPLCLHETHPFMFDQLTVLPGPPPSFHESFAVILSYSVKQSKSGQTGEGFSLLRLACEKQCHKPATVKWSMMITKIRFCNIFPRLQLHAEPGETLTRDKFTLSLLFLRNLPQV
jgi:hypothetical protein